jgi:hypothetical protein
MMNQQDRHCEQQKSDKEDDRGYNTRRRSGFDRSFE